MAKLICLNDPVGATGKEIFEFTGKVSATEMLMQAYPGGVDPDACAILINNAEFAIGSDELYRPLGEHDVVVFRNHPQLVGTAATWIYYAVVAVAVVAAIVLMPKPEIPGNQGKVKQSPNNTLQGQTNLARPYQGYPDVYGQPTSYPDLGGEAVVYYEDNQKFVDQFLCFGIGSYDVPPLNAGTSLLSNFDGATQEIILPTKKDTTFAAGLTVYSQPSPIGDVYILESGIESFAAWAKGSIVNITDLVVAPVVTGDDIRLDGEYVVLDVTSETVGPTTYSRMRLQDAPAINSGWDELANRGEEGTTFITGFSPRLESDYEAVTSVDYSFSVNEVDGQELVASNQGVNGISASTASLVTGISYTEDGGDFTFSVLANTEWDALKADFDASTIDYSVAVDYEYSKQRIPGVYSLEPTRGYGLLASMTLVPDVGGDYYDVVVSDFQGLVAQANGGAVGFYGDDVTVIERVGEILGPYVSPVEMDDWRVNIVFPRGLKWTDVFFITTNKTDELGNVQAGTEQTFEISVTENTPDQQFRTFDLSMSYGRGYYNLTISRTDASANSSSKPDLAKFESLNCMLVDNFRNFGNVTLGKIKVPATVNATSLRENKINAKIIRRTISYDLNTGIINYALNPSKRFADALLHEYVMVFKRSPDELDLDSLYEIQEKIDAANPELGEFSYTFDDLDIGLEDRMDAILNVARCYKWLDGDVYRFGRDEKREFIENVITQRDIASAQDRDYSLQYLSSMPTDYDSIKLEYVDANTNKKSYIYRKIVDGVIYNTAGLRPETFNLAGCYSEAQANDRADLEIRKKIYNRFVVTDTCLSQCSLLDKGQAVRYAEQYNFDTHDGEILSINGDIAYTSNGIEWDGVSNYFVEFKDEYNNVYRSAVEAVDGNSKAFRVLESGILANAYLPTGTEQLGSVYVIGSSVQLDYSAWTVTEKETKNNGNVTLTLTNYDERVFEKDVV